jgi:hypothetical protein
MSYNNISIDAITCSSCQHENGLYAVRCIRCGAILSVPGTLPVSVGEIPEDKLVDIRHGMRTIQHGPLFEGALFLYVLEDLQSIIVVEKQNIVLGRETPGSNPMPGDLSRFNAYALGVSRRHAHIAFEKGQYVLRDLGSANGTWINGQWLPPHEPYSLKNEDLIWLAKLVLMVYLAP